MATYSRTHECTAFYNCHTAWIGVTMSNNFSIVLCCHGNAFVNIRCSGNKCLRNRRLPKMTSTSSIILTFRQCLPSRCLANDHIPSQYLRIPDDYFCVHKTTILGLILSQLNSVHYITSDLLTRILILYSHPRKRITDGLQNFRTKCFMLLSLPSWVPQVATTSLSLSWCPNWGPANFIQPA
jgi:hypothetical protein